MVVKKQSLDLAELDPNYDGGANGRLLFEQVTKALASTHISAQPDVVKAEFTNVEVMYARRPGVIPKMWTPEEDQVLRAAVAKHGTKNWREIAEEVPQRNHLQCLQRWKKALRPGLVKGHWSAEEDSFLQKLMKEYPQGAWNWAEISNQIPGRNAKQCRERWFLNLDPSIYRGPWTQEEDEKLMKYHEEFGGRWSLIAKELGGRTENSVKTRFHSLQRRNVRSRGWIPEEDDVFIRGLLVYGRNYALCARLLPGRSRGQLKKRFPTLLQVKPELHEQVKQVEDKILNGHKPRPIHEMLTEVQAERNKRKQEAKQKKLEAQKSISTKTQNLSPRTQQPPVKREHTMKKFASSWIEGVIESISDPYPPEASATKNTSTFDDVPALEEDLDFLYDDVEPMQYEARGRRWQEEPQRRAPSRRESGVMILDHLLGNMQDSDIFNPEGGSGFFGYDDVQGATTTYYKQAPEQNRTMYYDEDTLVKPSLSRQFSDEQSYENSDSMNQISNLLSSNSWNQIPSVSNIDMSVV